jgi:hypothetical protein
LQKVRKWVLIGLGVTAVLVLTAFLVTLELIAPRLRREARQRTEDYLSKKFKGTVEIADFHVTILPRVRVEVDGVVLRHEGRTDIPPLIEFKKASFNANLGGLLGRKVDVDRIQIEGLQINSPPRVPGGPPMLKGTDQNLAEKYPVIVHEIVANDAILVMLRKPEDADKPPNQFEIHQLKMEGFAFDQPAAFQALLTNPKPQGLIHCEGEFGPWMADDPGATPVDGAYTFQHADMSTLKGISGFMDSTGHFRGPLDYLEVDGETQIPDFALRTSAHPVALHTDYSAVVDGTNGNTILKTVTARFGQTVLSVAGEVVDLKKGVKGRTIELRATSREARIEDLLSLAVNTSPPAMTGPAKLDARIDIPEEENVDVIDRMKLDGRFGVGKMEFADPSTQSKVDSLSRRGRGQPKDTDTTDEPSSLTSRFTMDQSTIAMTGLTFAVEGANISLDGTYAMDSGNLDFKGHLKLDAKLSQTTTGAKSFFLKAVDPFFAKHGAGTDLPIKITGTKDHPSFGLDLHDKANKN